MIRYWHGQLIQRLLAVLGFCYLMVDPVRALNPAVRWAVDHDMRWLGWCFFAAALLWAVYALCVLVSLLNAAGSAVWIAWRRRRDPRFVPLTRTGPVSLRGQG